MTESSAAVSAHQSARQIAFVTVVYFAQGVVPGLSLVALVDYLTAREVPLSQSAMLTAWIGLPWTLSFVWGPVIDNVRWFGTPRRAGWIFVMAAAACGPILALSKFDQAQAHLTTLATIFAIHSLFASIIDASTDALMIEMSPPDKITGLHAWGRGGLLCGTAGATLLFATMLPRYSFAVVAVTLAIAWMTCFLIAAGLYRSHWEGPGNQSNDPSPSPDDHYVTILLRRLFSLRSVATALVLSMAYAVYTVVRLITNYGIVDANPDAAETFSQVRGLVNLVVSVVMIVVAQVYLRRITLQRQSLMTAAMLGVFFALACGVGWLGLSHQSMIVIYVATLGFAKLLLYLTACRHYAILATPLTAGAQFTAYMAMLNVAEVIAAASLTWLGTHP